MYGFSEQQWQIVLALLVRPLEKERCSVGIFGSRARGDHRPFSDLDVLVKGQPKSATLSRIREELEESRLSVTVDIVLDHNLADSYRAGVMTDIQWL
jgi:predicted nucleotidyltransferase